MLTFQCWFCSGKLLGLSSGSSSGWNCRTCSCSDMLATAAALGASPPSLFLRLAAADDDSTRSCSGSSFSCRNDGLRVRLFLAAAICFFTTGILFMAAVCLSCGPWLWLVAAAAVVGGRGREPK